MHVLVKRSECLGMELSASSTTRIRGERCTWNVMAFVSVVQNW